MWEAIHIGNTLLWITHCVQYHNIMWDAIHIGNTLLWITHCVQYVYNIIVYNIITWEAIHIGNTLLWITHCVQYHNIMWEVIQGNTFLCTLCTILATYWPCYG